MKYPFLLLLAVAISCGTPSSDNSISYVDPFIGTGGHGHTYPGATRPFGMVQLSPDTRLDGWDGCSGYHYSDSIIYGFSHTHLSGTGVSDYGDILLMPYQGEVLWDNGADGEKGYRSPFKKSTEKASAGFYKVRLEKHRIDVSLTSSERVGFHRYEFSDSKDRKVLIDLDHRDPVLDTKLVQINDSTLSGYRHSKAWAENQMLFFQIQFNAPIQNFETNKDKPGVKGYVDFGEGNSELLVKVSISAVDEKGAGKNMAAEIPHWDFNKVKKESEEIWSKQLSKVDVKGGSEKQKRIFYTGFYHTMLAPNLYHDVDGRYRGTDLKIHQSQNFTNYTIFSLWDTYRSTHPLYTLLERERSNDFINTFLAQYQQGGQLPVWELAGNYTGCMIGYHSVPVITDAYVKGIRNYDHELALEAMIHSSRQDRLGIDHFRNDGFIASDKEAESVSKTLEYAYDDWAIAVLADSLGQTEIAEKYYQRGQQYKNVFDPTTGFMRARLNNQWFSPFKPEEVNFHYTEANSWQYSYYVPQDLEGWIKMLGGAEAAERKLDDLFSADSKTSGRDQADITGLIGQYAHGNEPSHHIPYLYNFVGAPEKTQKLVHQIMNELYDDQPDGLSGNEDCGQMSSWLVFSAIGFYPVTPGSTDYVIGSPWFDEATINLENGKSFTVRSNGEGIYIQSASLNGADFNQSFINHEQILAGGQLVFEMGNEPSDFGKDSPPKSSITSAKTAAIPAILDADRAFLESTTITITCGSKDAQIYYTFDDEKDWYKYDQPFEISESKIIHTYAEQAGVKSKIGTSSFLKIPEQRKITLATEYANHYSAGGDLGLIDFISGHPDFRSGGWQGYEGVNLDATVELESVREISQLGIRILQDENSWIFMPLEVEFQVSMDGKTFTSLGKIQNDISYKQKGATIKNFNLEKKTRAKFVRVIAINRGVCPPDHKGAGGKSWIFADEITIN